VLYSVIQQQINHIYIYVCMMAHVLLTAKSTYNIVLLLYYKTKFWIRYFLVISIPAETNFWCSVYCFSNQCLSFCPFLGHCNGRPSMIYDLWLPLWYLQTCIGNLLFSSIFVQFCHTAACKLTSVSAIMNPNITFPV
jgi:hypothetical protein